jgi:hypothetical protein
MNVAALGVRVKTGKAIAVVIAGTKDQPSVWKRLELTLVDRKRPETLQPYHDVLELPWPEADRAARKAAVVIHEISSRAFGELAGEIRAARLRVNGAGIVSGSDQDPARLGNPHIRAHAAEGRLFREAVEIGSSTCSSVQRCFVEKNIWEQACSELGLAEATLREKVTRLGSGVKPWRAEEKTAALAAWMILAGGKAGS